MNSIHHLRKDYKLRTLRKSDTNDDPFVQFLNWFNEATSSGIMEPNAMTLATATKEGLPSARIVLLKDFSNSGFTFFTNYNSKKGRQIAENNAGVLLFFWQELERQVRIEGFIEKVSVEESEKYFISRPLGSQISAVVSQQSSEVANRDLLEKNYNILYNKSQNELLVKPENWGGYILKPNLLEFWQGRSNRLHDRIEYKIENGKWMKRRLAP